MAPTSTGAKLKPTLVQRSTAGVIPDASPDLQWPNSLQVYDKMRHDSTCSSVMQAMTLPIRGTAWHVLDSPDVDPAVAQFVRTNLGLVEEGDSRQRRRGQGISWDSVLRHALLMLPFGHMFFEPVYTLAPPGPNDTGLDADRQYAHLARLAPIMPTSIARFNVDNSGELVSIEQFGQDAQGRFQTVVLPRQQIVPVVYDREGADWTGTSLLRAAYKPWWYKESLERTAASIVERNGMGVPVAEFDADHDRTELLAMLSSFRAGDLSGAAFPAGTNPRLLGVEGNLVDPMPLIAYHSQEIANSILAMFLTLGHDTGARSLGDTFVAYFTMAINAVIADLEETFTEEVSRRLVELNFGDQEAYPEIAADEITPQAPLAAEAIGGLVQAGVLTSDPALEEFVRRTFNIPPMSPTARPASPPDGPVPPGTPGVTPATTIPAGDVTGQPQPVHMSGETLVERETRLMRMRRALGKKRR